MERPTSERHPDLRPLAARVGEAALAAAWEERQYGLLVDDQGRRLQVVFPGRRWGGPGPDFRGALLAGEDGTLVRGDVEVHRRASGWRVHGHAANRAYGNVVLHVVGLWDEPTVGSGGARIPTIVLSPEGTPPRNVSPPCCRPAPELAELVSAAGRQRFAARTARFEGDVAAVGADQALWRGVAEALGYVENAAALARLADAVPWSTAAAVVGEGGPPAVAALLLGSAGLLVAASADEREWWPSVAPLAAGAADGVTWAFAAVRPGNHPARRCRGLAVLAAQWAANGSPAMSVVEAVQAQIGQRWPRVWPAFYVRPWIGWGRAQTIAVNVALPFAFALGCESAAGLYERLPGEPWSRPLRYMAGLLARPGVRYRSACSRQGLLQVFKTACAVRRCDGCPAGRPWRSDELDALPLIGWRQSAAAAAADHPSAADPSAAIRPRSEQGAGLERGGPLAAQHARQLNPLDAAHAGASFSHLDCHER